MGALVKMKLWGRKQPINLNYSIPVVPIIAISELCVRARQPESLGWGIWNPLASDWVRDTNGFVDNRVVLKNAERLLELIRAKSLLYEDDEQL